MGSKPHVKQIPLPKRWVLGSGLSSVLRRLRAPSPLVWQQFLCAGFSTVALAQWWKEGRDHFCLTQWHPAPKNCPWGDQAEGVRRAAEHTGWFGGLQAISKYGFVKNGEMLPHNLIFLLWLTEPRWHWSRKWNKYSQAVFSPSYLIHQKGHLTIQQHLIYIELLFMHPVNIRSNF